MTLSVHLLSDADRAVVGTTIAFIDKRMSQGSTLDWAMRLGVGDVAQRVALLRVVSHPGHVIDEPWRSGWRTLEESWREQRDIPEARGDVYRASARLSAGERSGALVAVIVDLVRPVLKVEPLSEFDRSVRSVRSKPRSMRDLMSVSLSSGDVLSPADLGLNRVTDIPFLIELAHGLDAALTKAMDIGRRLLDYDDDRPWRLGELRRAYFVAEPDRQAGEHEPDEFGSGIAPSVKLLHATAARVLELDHKTASAMFGHWRHVGDLVHRRLWAALARSPDFARIAEVAEFLSSRSLREFWDIHYFPELAELRALRFDELPSSTQHTLLARIRRGPPARQWPRSAPRPDVANARQYWRVRELRRVQVAGQALPKADVSWLKDQLDAFPDLRAMSRVDEGFIGTAEAQMVAADPDEKFNFLHGQQRLEALEGALSLSREPRRDDPGRRAVDWIAASGNGEKVVADLESTTPAQFPAVWEKFGWLVSPLTPSGSHASAAHASLVDRVLTLLESLPHETVQKSIWGISHWLDAWKGGAQDLAKLARVWLHLWPIACASTEIAQADDEEPSLSVVVQTSADEPRDLDTLNTPAGKLVGVLLASCPSLQGPDDRPFANNDLRAMRDAAVATDGRRVRMIVRHRLTEHLAYFLRADPTWTQANLIDPLLRPGPEVLPLWRAVARQTRSREVLRILGTQMALRAADERLDRRSREGLAFNVVVETLHALQDRRAPEIADHAVQQMLRSLDDEVRAHTANTVQRYIAGVSDPAKEADHRNSPEQVFDAAVRPFLETIWPQERTLATPGVARSFADLPHAARERFAEAVSAIERFLVPFDAWSLMEYGLHDLRATDAKLSIIDTPDKAHALLRLLNATVSDSEGAVVPSDLDAALEQISKVAPAVDGQQSFRRLAVLSRR